MVPSVTDLGWKVVHMDICDHYLIITRPVIYHIYIAIERKHVYWYGIIIWYVFHIYGLAPTSLLVSITETFSILCVHAWSLLTTANNWQWSTLVKHVRIRYIRCVITLVWTCYPHSRDFTVQMQQYLMHVGASWAWAINCDDPDDSDLLCILDNFCIVLAWLANSCQYIHDD